MAQKQENPRGFANKSDETYAPKTTKAEIASSAADALAKLEQAEGKVKVIHGANDGIFDHLVGQKVSAIRASLVDAFNIPADAQAYVDGNAVNDTHVLVANSTLEFVKAAGVKGHL